MQRCPISTRDNKVAMISGKPPYYMDKNITNRKLLANKRIPNAIHMWV